MMNTNFMNGMFGKIAPGMCKLSMSGGIAVKTSRLAFLLILLGLIIFCFLGLKYRCSRSSK